MAYSTSQTRRRPHRWIPASLCALCAVVLAAPDAPAQPLQPADRQQQSTLIEGLKNEGMSELLLHLVETEGDQMSAIDRQLLLIAGNEARFRDGRLPEDQRHAALNDVIESYRDLLANQTDDPRRAIWQTDFAEIVLQRYLRAVHFEAPLFYDFGVPTLKQREAYENTVAEAYGHLSEAGLTLFDLVGSLPQRADFHQAYVATGLWRQIRYTYQDGKTPFYSGFAAYYTAKLPDEHEYFQTLGRNLQVARQRNSPSGERRRLYASARRLLEPFANNTDDPWKIRFHCMALIARAELGLGNLDEADSLAQQIVRADGNSVDGLTAQLVRARVLVERNELDRALKLLDDVTSKHPAANANPLYYLLVVDQKHLMLQAVADNADDPQAKRAAVARAYEPYDAMFNDPKLKDSAEFLRSYVFRRWENNLKDIESFEGLPPMVLLALGQLATYDGHNLMLDADHAQGEKQTQLKADGQAKLQRGIRANRALLSQPGLSPAIRGQAMYNLGLGLLAMDRMDLNRILEGTAVWIDLASQQSLQEEAVAVSAIREALGILRHQFYSGVHRGEAQERVRQAYVKAAELIINDFSELPAADDERLPYGYHILQTAGRYADAARIYEGIPRTHSSYWESRRVLLECLNQVYRETRMATEPDAEAVRQASQALRDASRRIIEHAQADRRSASEQVREYIDEAEAPARIELAQLAVDAQQYADAREQIEGWQQRFGDQPGVARDFLELEIVINVEANELGDAITAAREMMSRFPDEARAIIDGVMSEIADRIDQVRRFERNAATREAKDNFRARRLVFASAGQQLADLLVNWARQQAAEGKIDAVEVNPYLAIRARALRMGDQVDQAIALLEEQIKDYPDEQALIYELAESYFKAGRDALDAGGDDAKQKAKEAFIQAARRYDRIIDFYEERPVSERPYEYWSSWYARLQMAYDMGEGVNEIPRTVRRLRVDDPTLGDPALAAKFRLLVNRAELYTGD